MKTLMKRTVSVILTLCLLMGFMLPMVSAETVVATVAGTDYTTSEEAVEAMKNTVEGDEIVIHTTVQFTADGTTINASKITLAEGATLDINGKKITASNAEVNATAPGARVISTNQKNDGYLVVDSLNCNSENGGYLPVQSTGLQWRFFKAAVEIVDLDTSVANTAKLKFRVVLTKGEGTTQPKYSTYLKVASTNIGGMFTWTANGVQKSDEMHDIVYADGVSLAYQWGQDATDAEKGNGDATKGAIVLTFGGLDSFDALSMTPYIRSSTGVVIKADVQTLKSAG